MRESVESFGNNVIDYYHYEDRVFRPTDLSSAPLIS